MKVTLLGWLFAIVILYAWSKTRSGHSIIYWGMGLICLFLLISNYQRITPLLVKKEE